MKSFYIFPNNTYGAPNFISNFGKRFRNLITYLHNSKFYELATKKEFIYFENLKDLYIKLYKLRVSSDIVTEKMLKKFIK
jgi:hypothetical protein